MCIKRGWWVGWKCKICEWFIYFRCDLLRGACALAGWRVGGLMGDDMGTLKRDRNLTLSYLARYFKYRSPCPDLSGIRVVKYPKMGNNFKKEFQPQN